MKSHLLREAGGPEADSPCPSHGCLLFPFTVPVTALYTGLDSFICTFSVSSALGTPCNSDHLISARHITEAQLTVVEGMTGGRSPGLYDSNLGTGWFLQPDFQEGASAFSAQGGALMGSRKVAQLPSALIPACPC